MTALRSWGLFYFTSHDGGLPASAGSVILKSNGVVKSPTRGVKAFFQDLDNLDVFLHSPEKTPSLVG
jgi:hypothetical protein